MPFYTAPAYAFGTLTSSGVAPTAADTVTVGSQVYTFVASATTVAGQVTIGASAAASLANLQAAINLGAGSGSLYGSGTVLNPDVKATTLTTTTLKMVSKVPGTVANFVTFAKSAATLTVSAATLTGGTFSIWAAIDAMVANMQLKSDMIQFLLDLDQDA